MTTGHINLEQRWGQVLLRIDIPTAIENDKMVFTTQWYGTHALYCATPVYKKTAIALAKNFRRLPYSEYDLRKEENNNLDKYENHIDDVVEVVELPEGEIPF